MIVVRERRGRKVSKRVIQRLFFYSRSITRKCNSCHMRLGQISIIDRNFQFNFTPHIRFVLFIAHLFVREQQKDVARSIDFKPTAHLIFIFILYYVIAGGIAQ